MYHGAGSDSSTTRIKAQTDNLSGMTSVCMIELTSIGVPELASLVEGSSDDLISVRIIKGNGIDDVSMSLES